MARTANTNGKFPSKIYFIKVGHDIVYGPYSKRPTSLLKEYEIGGGTLITFELDKQENYIKK